MEKSDSVYVMEHLLRIFPGIRPAQREQFIALAALYEHWNAQINVISRKDMEHFYERHVLHSLAIAKLIEFLPGSKILDVGTGGGFPGIPLAVFFPDVHFHLVDSIGKKIKVVQEVANALQLKNVTAEQARVETLDGPYDFVVSRAVAQWSELQRWTTKLISKTHHHDLKNGWLLLKGGDLDTEFAAVSRKKIVYDLSDDFPGEFFETKKIVYVPAG